MGWFRRHQESSADEGADAGQREPEYGRPSRCTACGGRGYLDHIDLGRRFQVEHCIDCGHRWETTFDKGAGEATPRDGDTAAAAEELPQVIDLTTLAERSREGDTRR